MVEEAREVLASQRRKLVELISRERELVCRSVDIEERNLRLKDELIDQKTLNFDLEEQSDKLQFLNEKINDCLSKIEEWRAKAFQAQSEAWSLSEEV